MLNDAIYVFFGHIRKDLAEHVAQKFAVLSKQTAFVVATQFYWTTVVKPLEVHVVAGVFANGGEGGILPAGELSH